MKMFVGTHNIPLTNFIKYMKDNYSDYVKVKQIADRESKYVLHLDDCFIFTPFNISNADFTA